MYRSNPNKRKTPSESRVVGHWAQELVEMGKFISVAEVEEDRYCFACGFKWSYLELAHILPRHMGGSDDPSNIHRLCRFCHRASEELHGETYWRWFERRHIGDVAVEFYIFQLGGSVFDIVNNDWEEIAGGIETYLDAHPKAGERLLPALHRFLDRQSPTTAAPSPSPVQGEILE